MNITILNESFLTKEHIARLAKVGTRESLATMADIIVANVEAYAAGKAINVVN